MNKICYIENLNKKFVNNLFEQTKKIKSEWPALEQVGRKKTVCLLFWDQVQEQNYPLSMQQKHWASMF